MKINPWHLKKKELQTYLTGYCKHRVPYQQHPNCFAKEMGLEVRRGILDIEFQNFDADYGMMLTYAIKVYHKKKIYTGRIKKVDIERFDFDKPLVKKLVKDLQHFNEIVTYYGTGCDLPYIRTRALKYNIDFPLYGFIKHKDIYYLVKHKLKLHRNSLESASKLIGNNEKDHVEPDIWRKAVIGDKKSIDYILSHNIKDVIVTEKLYDAIIGFSRKTNRSI